MSLFHYCATTLCSVNKTSIIKVERQLISAAVSLLRMIYFMSILPQYFASGFLLSHVCEEKRVQCVLLSYYLSRVICFGKSFKYHRTSWIYFCWRSGSFNQREGRAADFCLVLCRLIFIDIEIPSLTTVGNKG